MGGGTVRRKSSKYFSSRQKRKSFQTSLLSLLCVVLTCAAPRATAGDRGVGGARGETAETTATDYGTRRAQMFVQKKERNYT